MRRVYRNAGILLACIVLGGLWGWGWAVALSVLLGGALALVNFRWMELGVDAALKGSREAGAGGVFLRFLARLVLILGTFFVIIHTSFLSVLGALAGLSVFVLAGILEAIIVLVERK